MKTLKSPPARPPETIEGLYRLLKWANAVTDETIRRAQESERRTAAAIRRLQHEAANDGDCGE